MDCDTHFSRAQEADACSGTDDIGGMWLNKDAMIIAHVAVGLRFPPDAVYSFDLRLEIEEIG